MSRFVVIVMSDSRDDSDAVVHAVSALSQDREAEQEAAIAQMAGEREYAVAAAALREREEMRKRVHVLKIKATVAPGATATVHADSRFPILAASFKIAGENAHHFSISDLKYAGPGDFRCTRSFDFLASSNPVPAATFSDDGVTAIDLGAIECSAVEIVVHNTSKCKRTFRAQIIGFRNRKD